MFSLKILRIPEESDSTSEFHLFQKANQNNVVTISHLIETQIHRYHEIIEKCYVHFVWILRLYPR